MSDLSKTLIAPEEIVNFLKQEMNFKEVYQKILFNKVIGQVAEERGITVTTEEIEAEANRQRREKRLEKAADTMAWLADQLVTPDDWEIGIRDRLLSQKLAHVLFAEEVEAFFIKNKLDFEQVILYQIIVNSEKLAQEIYYQIEDGEISFYEAAHLYDINYTRRQKCGYEGKIYRFNLQLNIASVVFRSQPQELIGPLQTEQGYHLLMIKELLPAELTPEKYRELLNNMFHKWLDIELNTRLNSLFTC
ncbi:parvulin-like peptidyl-prolyl isomerase [Nostoc sp. PCC 7524]|uniref:peptidylprolyl isomerase n=1 Tax=Nostoc sp. (strain ATCC 29411 / PCC 7524) TaxID=28072 RepID=UPI00029ED859|nr:peptidylprolyl isomerase [Nostoc sp. PCC 7524]AFY49425.1 parvulin-like peptidyl-prolyl isomerase [Nostoc sp. PCC 7524]